MKAQDSKQMRGGSDSLPARSTRRTGRSQTISFRLSGDVLECLLARAGLHKLNRHKYARELVLEALQRNETEERMAQNLEDVIAEITALRSDSAFGVKAILMAAAKMPEDVADAWVRKNFKL